MTDNDVYKDQIMTQGSRTWSFELYKKLHEDLVKFGWRLTDSSVTEITDRTPMHMTHDKSGKKFFAHAHHPYSTDKIDPDVLLLTDVIYKTYPNKIYQLYPTVYGHFYTDFKYNNHLPSKKFNCFINRGCSFRQSWMYQLQRNNLLDEGYVSYWCFNIFRDIDPKDNFEELFLQNNQIFEQEHIALRGKIPYKNFDFSLEDATIDSSLSVVLETFFDDNNYVCYSEKIWRAIQLPRPWVMFNATHAVEALRTFGFDVFDDYVDHSYDLEPDIIARQVMIIEQIKKTKLLTQDQITDLEHRTKHNQQLMKQYMEEWPNKYKKIVETLKNISNSESRP